MRIPPRGVIALFLLLSVAEAFAAPAAPINLIATVNGTTVHLSWTPPPGGAPGYLIEASAVPGGTPIASVPILATSLVVPNAPSGTFFIRVRAADQEGLSDPSNEVIVTIEGCSSPPPAPTLSASATNGLVLLSWSPPVGACMPTNYVVRAGSASGLTDVASVSVGVQTALSANAPEGVYFLTVVAVNAFGASAPSNEVMVTVGSGCVSPPGPPQNFTSQVVGSTVTLRWDPPLGNCLASSYLITAGLTPGSGSLAAVQVAGTSLTVAAPNGTFYLRVFARNNRGTSGPSNEVTLVVGPPPPGVLHIVQDTVTLTVDAFGDALVIGQVTNGSPQLVTFPEVTAAFTNGSGGLVGSDSTFVTGRSRRLVASGLITDTSLAPGESGCFIMFTNVPAANVANASLSIGFDTFSASNLQGSIVLSGAPTRSNSLGDLRLDGLVANVGSRLTYFTQAAFLVKDPAGRALDCYTTFVDGTTVPLPGGGQSTSGVPIGQTAPYTAFTRVPFGQDASITGWTLWEEAASGSDQLPSFDSLARSAAVLSERERVEQRDQREDALRRQLRRR